MSMNCPLSSNLASLVPAVMITILGFWGIAVVGGAWESDPQHMSSPEGPLSKIVPSSYIDAANKKVEEVLAAVPKTKKRGPYLKYSPKEKARKLCFVARDLCSNFSLQMNLKA